MAGQVFKRCRCERQIKCEHPYYFLVDGPPKPGGKRNQIKRVGTRSKKETEALRAEAVTAARSGIDAGSGRDRVSAYLPTWLAAKRKLRPTVVKSYRAHIDNYLIPHLGPLRLSELRPPHLDAMYTSLLDPDREPQLTAATVRRVHATLRNALNQAVKQRLIPWNPALAVELPEERRPAVGVWSAEQVGAFLAFAADDRLSALWHVAVMCGMRRGELVGLHWRNVDLTAGQLLVVQSVTVADRRRHVGAPKTKKGERVVALDTGTVAVLRTHRRQQAEDRLAWSSAWQDTGLVFVREDGAMLNPDYVTRHFDALVRASGLPRITLHGLRHTCASLALAANVPVKVVSERLGHSTTAVTSNTYQHVLEAQARQAADAIAALVRTNVTSM